MSYGRTKIYTNKEAITVGNIRGVLKKAYIEHQKNCNAIKRLWNYYREKQQSCKDQGSAGKHQPQGVRKPCVRDCQLPQGLHVWRAISPMANCCLQNTTCTKKWWLFVFYLRQVVSLFCSMLHPNTISQNCFSQTY